MHIVNLQSAVYSHNLPAAATFGNAQQQAHRQQGGQITIVCQSWHDAELLYHLAGSSSAGSMRCIQLVSESHKGRCPVPNLTGCVCCLQSLSDAGNLSNLTSFVNNAVLFIVATTHVVELTKSAVTGNAGKLAAH